MPAAPPSPLPTLRLRLAVDIYYPRPQPFLILAPVRVRRLVQIIPISKLSTRRDSRVQKSTHTTARIARKPSRHTQARSGTIPRPLIGFATASATQTPLTRCASVPRGSQMSVRVRYLCATFVLYADRDCGGARRDNALRCTSSTVRPSLLCALVPAPTLTNRITTKQHFGF